jgi:eukaryotic-like serine/threonine-protein kinase
MLNFSSPLEPLAVSNDACPGERVSEVASARVGTTLKGKWRLDAVLGCGGTATVYAATHRNGNRVAVKVLHPCYSAMPAERERFSREGYLANKVEHPDVVRVLDEDVDDEGNPFLVMELLDGEPLVARWKAAGYRLPVPEVLWIGDRLLAVLEKAHARGIVHRDIKPENLFLTAAGGVKVLDFGIARLRGIGSGTMRGIVLGTPGFTAPEQARGEWDVVGARTDIWAVGATLFSLLTGRSVHEEEKTAAHLLRVSTEPVPPVRQIEPDLPDAVARLIDRALAFAPEGRFSTATEMRQSLAATYRLTTGQNLAGKWPGDAAKSAPYSPTLRVTTGTTIITRGSGSKQRTASIDRWDAVAMATAFFALGGIVVGVLASRHDAVGEAAPEGALVAPAVSGASSMATSTPAESATPSNTSGSIGALPSETNAPNSVAGDGETTLLIDSAPSKPPAVAERAPIDVASLPVAPGVATTRPAAARPVLRSSPALGAAPLPVSPVKRPVRSGTGDDFGFVETRH